MAKTTVTKCCSDNCAKKAYKARKRQEKIDSSITETQKIKEWRNDDVRAREFLTVVQVSQLIGCSKQNVYKLINTGKLNASNILTKKTIVRRSDLDQLFINRAIIPDKKNGAVDEVFNVVNCYSMAEIQRKFNVSASALQLIVNRNKIRKRKVGKYTYVDKFEIEALLK